MILGFKQAWRRCGPLRDRGLSGTIRSAIGWENRCRAASSSSSVWTWNSDGESVQSTRPLTNVCCWKITAAKFPELGGLDHFPLELIGEEYRVRRVWGDRPDPPEFLSRFHARQDEIRAELIRVDRELDEELADLSSLDPSRGQRVDAVRSIGPDPGGAFALSPRLATGSHDRRRDGWERSTRAGSTAPIERLR